MNVVYVTGNQHKAKYFAKMVRMKITHKSFDLDEIQSINLREVVEHKAKQAYELAKCPVIVEDTKLSFNAMGSLPGPLIKWFLEELGVDGICKLLDCYDDRTAIAGAAIAYYDGVTLEIFEKELLGSIALTPKGDSEFGWNSIFIPLGADKTLGEMEESEFEKWYAKIKPFDEIANFLKSLVEA